MAAPSGPLPLGWEGAPFCLLSFFCSQSLALALLSSDSSFALAVHRLRVRLAVLALVVLVAHLSLFFLLDLLRPLFLAPLVVVALVASVLRLLLVVLVDHHVLRVHAVLLLLLREAVVRLSC